MSFFCVRLPRRKKKTDPPDLAHPSLEEVLKGFADTDMRKADDFIKAIHEHLHTPSTSSSNTEKLSNWAPFIQSGATFLNFASDHAEKIDTKGGFSDEGQVTKIAGDILQQIGQLHWAVAGISILGYLISKSQKVSQNRTECADLLKDMLKLAYRIKHLHDMPLENESKRDLKSAFQYIVEGSVCCASQLDTGNFFSFLKTSINSETLSDIRSKIDRICQNDLPVIIGKETLQAEQEISLQLKEMSTRQPVVLPLSLQAYPKNAVGIEEQLKAVNTLLNMNNNNDEDQSSTSVVIWGFGGIGKSTLAKAVVSRIDRESYNYARIELDQDSDKNNYKAMQEQILKDAFPSYNGGREVKLRDDSDGRDKLAEAFQSETNKPVFLFIDNALHKKDLEKILPEDLQRLPKCSRLLITTRILNVTDVLHGIRRKDYLVKTLPDSHAVEVLCSHIKNDIKDRIKDDIEKMVKLCGGIPLVLKIVGARLHKQKYDVESCTQIREALESGGSIKQDDLSNRLLHFVYDQLEESTKEAFFDICCFFAKGLPRRIAECIVGAEEVASLQEAALITTVIGTPEYLVSLYRSTPSTVEFLNFMRMSEEEELLSVHDIIQSMGRSSSESSRIMDSNSWGKIEKDEGKFERIRGIRLDGINCVLQRRHLNLIKDTLRILVMKRGSIGVSGADDEDAVSFPELRYMRIAGDISWMDVEALDKLVVLQCEKLPGKQNGPLKLPARLRSLKVGRQPAVMQDFMPNSSLEELVIKFDEDGVRDKKESSAFYSRLGALNKLKTLEVRNCLSLCELTEDVCGLRELNRLSIIGCSNLERLSESYGQLIALRYLDLSGCRGLKNLPESFGQLKALTCLDLQRCEDLKALPESFGQLKALICLNLLQCTGLKELPESFGQLKALKDLDLSHCGGLKELPESFGQLKALTQLRLLWCTGLKKLPESFGQLKALKDLTLSWSQSLEELPCTFGGLEALQSLGLSGCERLKKLPSEFQQLRSLTYLSLNNCDHLESDICVKDESIKIVEKSEHSCTNCWHNQKLRIFR